MSCAGAQTATDQARLISLSEFFKQPVGPRGLEFTELLRASDGGRVRLQGFMVMQESPVPGQFMLTPRPVRMSEHADGEADDLPPATVTVLLDQGHRDRVVAHQPGLIQLVGRLQVGRHQDALGRVSWVLLHLDPQAVAIDPQAPAPSGRIHTH